MIRPLAILCCFYLTSFAVMAHGDKTPVYLQGTIVDGASGGAISGAVISIEYNGEIIHSVETDAEGGFALKYEGSFPRKDKVRVSIFKKGYKVQKVKPLECAKDELHISLAKKPKLIPLILPASGKAAYDI